MGLANSIGLWALQTQLASQSYWSCKFNLQVNLWALQTQLASQSYGSCKFNWQVSLA